MSNYFKVCPYCGAHLDHGERCDCPNARYGYLASEMMQDENTDSGRERHEQLERGT